MLDIVIKFGFMYLTLIISSATEAKLRTSTREDNAETRGLREYTHFTKLKVPKWYYTVVDFFFLLETNLKLTKHYKPHPPPVKSYRRL